MVMKSVAIGNPELWAKFGLPGLIIFSLFIILVFIVWFTVKRFDKIDERNLQMFKGMSDEHRDERKEWQESNSKQIDKFEAAITRLADGIRDTRN
jgi:hypothetical protein